MGLPHYSMDDPESDYHNFSQSSSSHRLPTLNGVEALLDAVEKHKPISTNLLTLDSILCESGTSISPDGGVPRGGVTEIYGAPGSGKTHFAMQLTANVLRESVNAKVVWIDTASEFPYSRLEKFLNAPKTRIAPDEEASQKANGVDEDEPLPMDERLNHLYISSLPHLLSILMHPTRDFIPEDTSLLVIDDFSGIVMDGLPQDERVAAANPTESRPSLSRDDIMSKSIAIRRAAMLSSISAGLARLAASWSLAVIVLSKATSGRRLGSSIATMRSTMNSSQWNENVAVRIVLYRMFWPKIDWRALDREARRKQRKRERHALRVAQVERIGGRDVHAEGVRFVILNSRLQAVDPPKPVEVLDVALPSSPPQLNEDNEEAMGNLGLDDAREEDDQSMQMPEDMPASSVQISSQASKRKVAEIADSEDEDELEAHLESRKSSRTRFTTGFLPSSQVSIEENGSVAMDKETDEQHAIGQHDSDHSDEMLLRD